MPCSPLEPRAGDPRGAGTGPSGRPTSTPWSASAGRAAAASMPTPAPNAASWDAAVLAAGAGARRRRGARPGRGRRRLLRRAAARPSRHADARPMGFCLLNNVAVTAAHLAARGERVADRRLRRPPRQRHPGPLLRRLPRALRVPPRVPAVPGHGRARRRPAAAPASGATLNLPVPEGTTGDVYLRAFDEVVAPVDRAGSTPTWLLLSAGFDAHRARPDHRARASSGDFAALTARLVALVPAGRLRGVPRGWLRPPGPGRLDRRGARRRSSGVDVEPEAPDQRWTRCRRW